MAVVLLLSLLCLMSSVGMHYECFRLLSAHVPRLRAAERWRIMTIILGALSAHLLEIGVFAAAMAFLHQLPVSWNVGDLKGAVPGYAPDYLYCSAMSYTTLGFEQITPEGAIRFLIGVEALTGVVLVAWSASFTYLQMSRYWGSDPPKPK
jgi:hypothetical protein